MKNPCFNEETRTDCPRRHLGCAADCPEWAEYCAERDAKYDERAEAIRMKSILSATARQRGTQRLKKHIYDRENRYKH